MIRLRDITATGWLAVACLALALILLTMCAVDDRQKAAERLRQAEAHKTLAEGRTAAAQDASAIRDRADARDQSTASIVTQAEKEIRHASDRNAAADAARRRVCQLSDYRDAQCAVFRTDPGRVD
ncbi:hypothetical protein FM111_01830 [Brevundimonas diminuta 3F5N]|uniref:Uncharacterized protein n=1 Tax=Brevundimonas diminuta 3F5N TaxID=1255603 RepID=A0A1R4F0P2_BREDI|nr:hypothetical protein [Brevundimonas diminuta]SJM49446.1 hypothetical protein FM111_01830 [Brevundimonas diminuta 3F5N]